jgi:hypothetical protein
MTAADMEVGKPVSPVLLIDQGNGRLSHLPAKPQYCSG